MPYIKKEDRIGIELGYRRAPANAGELNYMFTIVALAYWRRNGRYQAINDIVGALEGAKLEFYRRVAAPYEDAKIEENGDVYSISEKADDP